jgi:hypothetical protein
MHNGWEPTTVRQNPDRKSLLHIRPIILRIPINQLAIWIDRRPRRLLVHHKVNRRVRLCDPNLLGMQRLFRIFLSFENPDFNQVMDRNLYLRPSQHF